MEKISSIKNGKFLFKHNVRKLLKLSHLNFSILHSTAVSPIFVLFKVPCLVTLCFARNVEWDFLGIFKHCVQMIEASEHPCRRIFLLHFEWLYINNHDLVNKVLFSLVVFCMVDDSKIVFVYLYNNWKKNRAY